MATAAFQPIGSRARWRDVYEHVNALDHGTVIPYEELSEIVGFDIRENRGPVYRASVELELEDHKSLVVEPKIGYRVALPSEHKGLTERHRKRSYRQLRTARRKADSADRSKLTPEERRWLDETSVRLSQHETAIRNLHQRVKALERGTEVNQVAQSRIEREMGEMREALRQAGLLKAEEAA